MPDRPSLHDRNLIGGGFLACTKASLVSYNEGVAEVKPKQKAVFLDRDGTLNDDPGYIDRPEKIVLFPSAANAIRRLNEAGRKVVVVTNQSGVGRGLFEETTLHGIHAHLVRLVEAAGGAIDAIYYCPHYPIGGETESHGESPYRRDCDCRKPKPGMLLRAARDLNLDLESSVVIGDRYLDIEMAHAVGARGILVLTGYGQRELDLEAVNWPRMPDMVAQDLTAAVDAALSLTNGG